MGLNVLRLVAVMLTAVAMASGLAHLLALPNKIRLGPEAYLTAQQIYRGWALLGIVIVGALGAIVLLAVKVRRDRVALALTASAGACVALSLGVFFAFTYPANQQTGQWTFLPDHWEALRRQWEYAHAVSAVLELLALAALTASLLWGERGRSAVAGG